MRKLICSHRGCRKQYWSAASPERLSMPYCECGGRLEEERTVQSEQHQDKHRANGYTGWHLAR